MPLALETSDASRGIGVRRDCGVANLLHPYKFPQYHHEYARGWPRQAGSIYQEASECYLSWRYEEPVPGRRVLTLRANRADPRNATCCSDSRE